MTEDKKGGRYIVEYADVVMLWQKGIRVYDTETDRVIMETDSEESAEEVARSLNSTSS